MFKSCTLEKVSADTNIVDPKRLSAYNIATCCWCWGPGWRAMQAANLRSPARDARKNDEITASPNTPQRVGGTRT